MIVDYLHKLLQENQALLFFVVLGFGYLLGKIKVKGFEFGPVTGVLFVGLVFGHFGYGENLPVQSIGFMMFIYSVGLQAGPRFFSVLRQDGLRYFILAIVVAVSGFTVAAFTAQIFNLEPGSSAGILAGSLTTTPTLAAAEDAIRSGTILPPEGFSKDMMLNNIMTGYAITYLFGLIGLILLIRFIPMMTRVNLAAEAHALSGKERFSVSDPMGALGKIVTRAFLVTKDELVGIPFGEFSRREGLVSLTAYKIKRGEEFVPFDEDTSLQLGDKISFIGSQNIMILGPEKIGPEIVDQDLLDSATETCRIVVTKKKAAGLSVSQHSIIFNYGCVLAEVKRLGVSVPLVPQVELQRGDVLTVTGPIASIERMQKEFGHAERNIDETDLLTFALGIAVGILIGSYTIRILGIDVGLGTAGGLLLVGLMVGFLRSIYPAFGRMPSAARYVLMELGMLFFMSAIGFKAGHGIVEALSKSGPALIFAGMVTTIIPVLFSYFFGRKILKINPVLLLGAITGAMTSGACLSIVNKEAKSTIPSLGYTGAYAFANIILTVAGSLILLL
jgi:putative transport protein